MSDVQDPFSVSRRIRLWIGTFVAAGVLLAGPSGFADECPGDGLSKACCARAKPLDGLSRDKGGYAWHPGPSGNAGLCQGLASRKVSGRSIQLLELREDVLPSTLSERLVIQRRDPPWTGSMPFSFSGAPLVPGNAYFIAGTFELGGDVEWQTKPFVAAGQRLSNFGFFAITRHKRRTIYTPVRIGDNAVVGSARSAAQLVLRSTEAITDASVTAVPLDAGLVPDVTQAKELVHAVQGARSLSVALPVDLPELFLVSVALCTASDPVTCSATGSSPAAAAFRIVWPDAP